MQILLSPMRRDTRLEVSISGEVLTLNGADLDLSAIPEGATLPAAAIACDWIAGDITRQDGVLIVPLIVPHGSSAPPETLFPAPVIAPADGPLSLPPYEIEEEHE